MPRTIEWKLVLDETGAVKKMEEVGKEAETTDSKLESTKKSAKDAEGGIKSLGDAFGGLKNVIGMALGAAGFGGLTFGLESIVKTTYSVAEETEHFQKASGMGAQASLDYVAAMKARGMSSESLVKAYKGLGKAVESAERQQYSYDVGSAKSLRQGVMYTTQLGSQAEGFERLGINMAQLKAASPEKQFQMLTDKFEHLHNGMEKTNLATMIFGRSGKELLPMLTAGSESLAHYDQMAKRFFPTLGGEGVRTMEQLREKQAESKMAWEGLEFTLGMKLAPILSAVMGWFSKLILSIEQGHGVWGVLEKDLAAVWGAGEDVYHFLMKTPEVLYPLIGALGVLAAAWQFEKVLEFYRAIKSLTLLQAVVGWVKGLATADVALAGAEETAAAGAATQTAANEAVSASDVAATAAGGGGLLARLGIGAGAAGLGEAVGGGMALAAGTAIPLWLASMFKAPFGMGEGHSILHEASHVLPLGPFTQAAGPSEGGEKLNLAYGDYEQILGPQFGRYSPKVQGELVHGAMPYVAHSLHEPLAQAQQQFKEGRIEITINGAKVGEAIARDANAMRFIAEGTERYSQYRNARR